MKIGSIIYFVPFFFVLNRLARAAGRLPGLRRRISPRRIIGVALVCGGLAGLSSAGIGDLRRCGALEWPVRIALMRRRPDVRRAGRRPDAAVAFADDGWRPLRYPCRLLPSPGSTRAVRGGLIRVAAHGEGRNGHHVRRSGRHSRSRFRPLHRRSVLRHDAGRSRRRGDPHREARGQRGPLGDPGRRGRRRRHVPPDGPQQARPHPQPDEARGPRDREEAGRGLRRGDRQPALRRPAEDGHRLRHHLRHQSAHHPRHDLDLRLRRPLRHPRRLRHDRPGDVGRHAPVGRRRGADPHERARSSISARRCSTPWACWPR